MRVIVVTPVYALSGVPLAQIRLAKVLARIGHNVTLIIGKINKGFELPLIENIDVIVLGKKRVITMFKDIINISNSSSPDVIFSAEDHLNIIIMLASFLFRKEAKISCSSRVTPFDTYSKNPFKKGFYLKFLMQFLMNRADVLSCVSEDMVTQYQSLFKNSRHQRIYNIIGPDDIEILKSEKVNHDWFNGNYEVIIGAGNLSPWKGFTDLIKAFSLIKNKKSLKLVILGDGPEKHDLVNLIYELKLEDNIQLLGNVSNPFKYFSKSSLFVLSSRVEGLPNVIVEAMMCGCKIVSYDCPTGPREILQNGKYGTLVKPGDISMLSSSMIDLLKNTLPGNYFESAFKPFMMEQVLEQHRKSLKISKDNFYPRKYENRS